MTEAYILAALEFLIQYGGTLSIYDLWINMCHKFKDAIDFPLNIGSNLNTFENFLINNPTMFVISNGFVYLCEISNVISGENVNRLYEPHPSKQPQIKNLALVSSDFQEEAAAVKYLQDQLQKKCERWIPIKSLAGHLSQASAPIRSCVGPQSEFTRFLMRHPMVFEIQGELVGLKEKGILCGTSSNLLPSKRKGCSSYLPDESVPKYTTTSNKIGDIHTQGPLSLPKLCDFNKLILIVDDCKAIMWLLHSINKTQNAEISIKLLLSELVHAPSVVRSCTGWTQIELLEFLEKYMDIFKIRRDSDIFVTNAFENMHLVAVKTQFINPSSTSIKSQRGCIFCINKLWGIIDLGFHEHVFFDRSLFKNVSDLRKHFKVKEVVYFDASLATEGSRAKWRATCVWKASDQLINHLFNNNDDRTRTNQFNEDPDSGLDNSDDLKENKTVLKTSNCMEDSVLNSSTDAIFNDVLKEFEFAKMLFHSIVVVEPWEIEQFNVTKNKQLTNYPVSKRKQKIHLKELNNSYKENELAEQEAKINFNPSPTNLSSSDSHGSVSELNTLSEISSISQQVTSNNDSNATGNNQPVEDIYSQTSMMMNRLDISDSFHIPGCTCQCQTLIKKQLKHANPNNYSKNSGHYRPVIGRTDVATQTVCFNNFNSYYIKSSKLPIRNGLYIKH